MNSERKGSKLTTKLSVLFGILILLVLLAITFPSDTMFIIANIIGTCVLVFMVYVILYDNDAVEQKDE